MNIIWKKINSNASMFSISDTVKPKLTKSKLMEEALWSGVKKNQFKVNCKEEGVCGCKNIKNTKSVCHLISI